MRAQRGRCSGARLGRGDRCTPPQRNKQPPGSTASHEQQPPFLLSHHKGSPAYSSWSQSCISNFKNCVHVTVCHCYSIWSGQRHVELLQRICLISVSLSRPETDPSRFWTVPTRHTINCHDHFCKQNVTINTAASGTLCYISTRLRGITTRQTEPAVRTSIITSLQ
jgi:hypothetical protein